MSCFQQKQGRQGGWSLFTLDEEYVGFVFVLKINVNTWLNYMGNDFYIPLSSSSALPTQPRHDQSEGHRQVETDQAVSPAVFNDGIIDEIRSLVSDISSEKSRQMKSKEAQESILQEIEKLAAEAYSIFRSSIPTYSEIWWWNLRKYTPLHKYLQEQVQVLKFSAKDLTGSLISLEDGTWSSLKELQKYLLLVSLWFGYHHQQNLYHLKVTCQGIYIT